MSTRTQPAPRAPERLLTGSPVGIPTEEAARIVRLRRVRAEKPARPLEEPLALPVTGRIAELHEELTALRAENARHRDRLAALADETRELLDRLEAGGAATESSRG